MSERITIRTEESLRRAFEQRAREQGKSISVLMREEIIARSAEGLSMSVRLSQLRGTLDLGSQPSESWRHKLAERNWRS